MATKVQISCINKSDRTNPHERILNVGGLNADGTRWQVSEARAIQFIEAGEFSFFVGRGTLQADVVIASRLGKKYLKTVADGERPDNLLALPECPA
jgi:hypothetical protein